MMQVALFMGSRFFLKGKGSVTVVTVVWRISTSPVRVYSLNCSEYTEQEHVSCYICDVYYSFYKKKYYGAEL